MSMAYPFMFVNLIMVLAVLVGYVFLIVIGWRFMQAHESLANSVKEIAETLKSKHL